MTVGELMAKLSDLPLDTEVVVSEYKRAGWPSRLSEVQILKGRTYKGKNSYVGIVNYLYSPVIETECIGDEFSIVYLGGNG